MQAKTTQKISRSAVATVLATSTVALGLPAQTNATILFNDVKPADFFYTAVNELSEKKIVNGYGDGTFRPFNSVTRGEAAKMLALSLKLDVTNAETTQFSDVKKGDIFYKYIAALANKGIINGYPDGSFKPNEVVQRGAMAKMVALGYEFILATNITHPFKDVDQKNIFNQHIQTLVNLNITKGTSFNTFEPAKAVTRGELATFISRANKANAGKPIYVVDNIIGNKIYINSVGYTIGSNVASYIKVENKSALIGAHVEGTFNGMTLTNVTRLTLNATGNANSIYTFDGGNSTFNGTLVVNGSYLKFKNWTLNGQTIVSETPRKSLAQYNRISELKIASLASGIIDFTRPTNPDDGNLNDGDNGSLKPGTGTSPYAPYSEKLSPIYKYVDFTNVTVRNLFVEQNRTYVAAQKEIAMVTIRRDVEFAELNFNMRNLYLEGDESLTLYGTHDIETVYKNTFYSVYFNSDSEIDTLIVDNSNGWIDLGDYVVVDKVIIPPKTTPNDIFDDYKNDNDKIGTIEDNTGEEVDRDPIENGIVPDVTKPFIHALTVVPDSVTASVTFTVDEEGQYRYIVVPKGSKVPTVREVVEGNAAINGSGDVELVDKTPDGRFTKTFVVNELESLVEYTIYLVHVDNAGNYSGKVDKDFKTKDGTPPYVDQVVAKGLTGGKRIQVDFKPNELSNYYLLVREQENPDTTLTTKNIMDEAQYTGEINQQDITNGFSTVLRSVQGKIEIKPETKYVVYVVLVDESGNISALDSKYYSRVTTNELDDESPYVTGPTITELQHLIPVPGTLNQFYMYFNERLDKVTAENVDYYSLSGTGIINIPGQQPIKPTSVRYEDYQDKGRVLITIPSLTGFIDRDTLRVTVSSEVMDLAENNFESLYNNQTGLGPRNYAQYTHNDNAELSFTINRIERVPTQNRAFITYNTTKAGQVYYMLLPDSFDISTVRSDEFVAEFGSNPTNRFNTNTGGKVYLEGDDNSKLNRPFTTEKDEQMFTYDYSSIRSKLSRTDSYSLYMVMRDRSGNLSDIEKALVIADEEPPRISSFNVLPTVGSNTSVDVTLTSENEGGNVWVGYFEKYVPKVIDGQTKYVLNDLIYDSSGNLKSFGTSTSMTNEERKSEFKEKVTNYKSFLLQKGLFEESISNLSPNKEYVFYVAAIDEFGNFTVKHTVSNQENSMIKDVYTDGIAPIVLNNVVYRTVDDQLFNSTNNNGEFIITFSEAIGRVYSDSNTLIKENLDEESALAGASIPDLSKILEITAGGTPITDQFEFVSYTPGNTINSLSKLRIRAINNTVSKQNFTVKVNVHDHNINGNNNGNEVVDLSKYIYPVKDINKIIRATLQPDGNNTNNDSSTKMKVELDLQVSLTNDNESLSQNFYYAVVNDNSTTELSKSEVEEVILKADNGANENLSSNITAYGKIALHEQADLSKNMDLVANESSSNSTTNVFRTTHNLFIFTKDKYGNIIWAKSSNNSNQNYITIDPIGN